MSKDQQKKGKEAEERVVKMAQGLGMSARFATPQEDHGNSTDAFVNDRPVQISLSNKSKREREKLKKKGIVSVEAGNHVSDATLVSALRRWFGK